MIDTSLASDHFFGFIENPLERIKKSIMATDHKMRNKKLEYDVKRQPAEMSALPSGKINKHEYLTSEENLCSDLPLGKVF